MGKQKEFLIIFGFFLLIAIYKFWLVITSQGHGLSNDGDGLGGLMWFEVLRTILTEDPWRYLSLDILENPHVGAGLMPNVPSTGIFWRVVIVPLLITNTPLDNIYDLLGMIIYTLNGVTAFYLARVLGGNFWIGIFCGLIFIGLDNVTLRLGGHLFLAAYFGVILQTIAAVMAGKRGKYRDYIFLALSSWLSFQTNEYYGFYGSIYSLIIFGGYTLFFRNNLPSNKNEMCIQLKKIAISVSIFITMMLISYPTIILGKIGISQSAVPLYSNFLYDKNELMFYSVLNPLQFFWPKSYPYDFGNPGEFSFRLGPGILVFIMSAILFLLGRNFSNLNTNQNSKIVSQCAIFFTAGIVLALIAQRPGTGLSFANIIFQLAPMFRVAARTYILVEVSLIAIFILMLTALINRKNKENKNSNIYNFYLYASIIVGCFFVYASAVSNPMRQFSPLKLPDRTDLFKIMDSHGPGAFLQLPLYSASEAPEKSYAYLYDWTLSKRTMVNAPMHKLQGTDYILAKRVNAFSESVNLFDHSIKNLLSQAGVRFIVANCNWQPERDLSLLEGVKLVVAYGCLRLYELENFSSKYNMLEAIKSIHISIPDQNIKITRADCTGVEINVQLINEISDVNSNIKNFSVDLTRGPNGFNWGNNAAEVLFGVMYFPLGKQDHSYLGNIGQTWVNFPVDLKPNDSIKFRFTVNLPPSPLGNELWFSPVQPGNLWCFSEDGLGKKVIKLKYGLLSTP